MSKSPLLLLWAGVVLFALLAGPVAAQTIPLSSMPVATNVDSGLVENTGSARAIVFSDIIYVPGASWLRLSYGDVVLAGDEYLGTGSYLRITSLSDSAYQTQHYTHTRQWQNTSAYFNGEQTVWSAEVAKFETAKFKPEIEITDEALAEYFETNQLAYRHPRRIHDQFRRI